jgi:hypothetical protein
MAHIIEVVRDTAGEARSFLDALFYSDSVSAIGHRADRELIRAVVAGWEADEESDLDERIWQMVSDAIEADDDLDEITARLSNIFRNRSLSA